MNFKPAAIDLVRAELLEIKSTAEVSDRNLPARLLANESSLNPTFLLQELCRALEQLEPNRYWLPEQSTSLLPDLGRYTGLAPEYIMVGNGADELIQATMLTFLRPRQTVVMAWPSYPMYPYLAETLNLDVEKVELNDDFSLPVDELLSRARKKQAPLIVLCNPNNPTGNLFSQSDIGRLLSESDSIVVVDEAYFEFSGTSVAPLIREFDRLVVWRTFSKAFSLAGMRIGYLLAQPQLVTELKKVRLPFNLSNISQWLAQAALRHVDRFHSHVTDTVAERNRVEAALQTMRGVRVYPSETNFLLFKTGLPAPQVHRQLLDKGVLIRQVEHASALLQGCLRVSIGSPAENDLFLKSLQAILN